MERCKICQGTGLVRRKTPYVCPGLHSEGILSCVRCENVPKGLYVTCEECYGEGEIKQKAPKQIIMNR